MIGRKRRVSRLRSLAATVAPAKQAEANGHAPQEQHKQCGPAALGRAPFRCGEAGELTCVQPLLLLKRRGGCLAGDCLHGTVSDRCAQDALDLLGDLRRVGVRLQGYADQGAPLVSEAGRSALHAVDLIQARQHGRDQVRSAAPGWRQGWPGKAIDLLLAGAGATAGAPGLLAAASATVNGTADYLGQAEFRKAGHHQERAEPGSPARLGGDHPHGTPRSRAYYPGKEEEHHG
jgi:hypothetical protein